MILQKKHVGFAHLHCSERSNSHITSVYQLSTVVRGRASVFFIEVSGVHFGGLFSYACTSQSLLTPLCQTPDPGINFDTTSILKAPVAKDDGNHRQLGWFRTMIECNRERPPEKPQNWPDISQGILFCWFSSAIG